MKITDEIEYAGGSIIGKYHLRINFNNQDNYIIKEHPDHIVAVVCDGCGSGPTSEVGSTLGSSIVAWELTASGLHKLKDDIREIELCLERTKRLIVDRITTIAFNSGLPLIKVIYDSFLFTIIATVIGKDYTYIISFGDGFYVLNGKVQEVGPFENNAPPYISYNAIDSYIKTQGLNLNFVINEIIPTPELDSLLIATDGLGDFIKARDQNVPGKSELVGPVSQFWENDLFFSNEAMVSRRLSLVNRSISKIDRTNNCLVNYHGHLKDDTTLISIRKKDYHERIDDEKKLRDTVVLDDPYPLDELDE